MIIPLIKFESFIINLPITLQSYALLTGYTLKTLVNVNLPSTSKFYTFYIAWGLIIVDVQLSTEFMQYSLPELSTNTN